MHFLTFVTCIKAIRLVLRPMRKILTLIAACCALVNLKAQALQPGAIAFIALQTDNPAAFAFVNLVEIQPGTEISFTDNKWGFNHLVLSEQTVVWTSPDTLLPIGTIVRLRDDGSDNMAVEGPGTTQGRLYIMSGAADQVLAYVGPQEEPSFIAGISSTNWRDECDSLLFFQFRTCLPAPLVNGLTAIAFTNTQSFAVDNGYFAITPFAPSGTDMLSIINNINYWFLSNGESAQYENWPDWNSGTTLPFASSISFNQENYTITEGGSLADITLSLSAAQFTPQTAVINVLQFPGITEGDFQCNPAVVAGNITLQIPANTTELSFSVQALLDGIGELDENITFSIGALSGGLSLGEITSTLLTIVSTEQNLPQVSFSTDTVWVTEGGLPATVNLNLSPALPAAINVIVTAVNGPGIQTDYFTTPTAFNNQLLLLSTPNSSTLGFSVTPFNDFQIEADEIITFTITTVVNGVQIGNQSSVTVVIRDDDNAPIVYIPEVFINELCAINLNYPDENGQLDDWIELYNADTATVNLSGYSITNNPNNPQLFVFPPVSSQVTMPPGSFKVLWADQNTVQGPLHLNFTLSESTPGYLALYYSDGETLMDAINYTPVAAGSSFGRYLDGSGNWKQLFWPTPGAPNSDSIPSFLPEAAESQNVSVFPNPSTDLVQVVWKGAKTTSPIRFEWMDVSGRKVDLQPEPLVAGKSWAFRPDGSPGLYFLLIHCEGRTEAVRIMRQ